MPELFVALEHIGSKAVPGLAAKPVIDLMGAVRSLDDVPPQEARIEELGYRRRETGMSNRLFYRRSEPGLHA